MRTFLEGLAASIVVVVITAFFYLAFSPAGRASAQTREIVADSIRVALYQPKGDSKVSLAFTDRGTFAFFVGDKPDLSGETRDDGRGAICAIPSNRKMMVACFEYGPDKSTITQITPAPMKGTVWILRGIKAVPAPILPIRAQQRSST